LDDYVNAFERAAEAAGALVYVAVSSRYSKAYALSLTAREKVLGRLSGVTIDVLDSKAGATGHGLLALEVARLAQEGAPREGILRRWEEVRARTKFLMVFETLKYLARGGRIHHAQAWLGSILRVKPVLTYSEEGETIPITRVRTAAQGLEFIVEEVRRHLEGTRASGVRFVIDDADNPEWAEEVKERLGREFSPEESLRWTMSPVVGAHIGPGSWGVAWYPVPKAPDSKEAR
jgi:DegV family protein with EDD domain